MAFQNMKFYKFYPVPTPDSPDVSNVKVIFAIFIRLLIWLLDLGSLNCETESNWCSTRPETWRPLNRSSKTL